MQARKRAVWIAWLGMVPVFLIAAIASHLWLSEQPFIPFAAIAASFVTWMVVVWRNGHVRYPRCGESFYQVRRGWGSPTTHWNPWRRACGQCGLSLDELER